MKIKAKLTVIAVLLVLIFFVGSVSAVEDTNVTSDNSAVSSVQTLSVSEPIEDTQTTDVDVSDSDDSTNSILKMSSDDSEKSVDEAQEASSDSVESQNTVTVLSASSENEILGETIPVEGNYFVNFESAVSRASAGDIIDLGGKTIIGVVPTKISFNKAITVINGTFDGGNIDTNVITITRGTFINVNFVNFYSSNSSTGDCFNFFNSTLINCTFDNCTGYYHIFRFVGSWGNKLVSGALINCNVTNSQVLYDGRDKDDGQVVHMLGNVTADGCYFINTSSNHHAGAICMDPAGAIVKNSYFINCSAWIGGAIYVHGHMDNYYQIDSVLENCVFINCSATEDGGAIATNYGGLHIKNCEFYDNTAEKGAAIMIGGINYPDALRGDNKHGHNITIEDCIFINNTGTGEGGAVHVSGDNDTIKNCYFDNNYATDGEGAAVFIEGENASIINSQFYNHQSVNGTVHIEGNYASVEDSTFKDNNASHGGAGVFIDGDYTLIKDCTFENNTAHIHGGAVHTRGDHINITNNEFRSNSAIPDDSVGDDGLGGAIYIDGKHNSISYSEFRYNTARNGSAIYNNGESLTLIDDDFYKNQAWSYVLITEAKPPESYWSEDTEVLVNVTLIAGDNLINAIYNNASTYDISFYNVTYTLKPNDLYPQGVKTTTEEEIHPVDGIDLSDSGRLLYQDAREDDQKITLNITYDDNVVFDYTGQTDMHGNILLAITKENLTDDEFHPGVYTVNALHPDDEWYTAISNSTTFTILPHVDVSVTKTSDKDVYFVGEKAVFTITVNSVGTNATNVYVEDILPPSLIYVSSSATQGSYDSSTNNWTIGFMPHGSSATLTLTVQTTELGDYDNVVIVNCTERDWNLSNNIANKTIHVDLYYTKEVNVTETSAGQYIEYYLRVFNRGNTDYTETVRISDVMPDGVKYVSYELIGADLIRFTDYTIEQIWDITNITAGMRAKITVKAITLKDGIWNNTMKVWDYPEVNASVNVSSVADVRVIKDVSSTTVNKNDIVNWTIQVKNEGPSIAQDVYVIDVIPDGLSIVGYTQPSKGNYYREQNRWSIGDMAVGETATLIISTRVTVSGQNITNEATVNATTPDPNPDNNYDNETTYANPEGDVGVEKTASTHYGNHSDTIYWTITVTNYGPDTATGVVVTDVLPEGLRYINSTVSKGQDYNRVTGQWKVGTLEKGENATLVIYTLLLLYDTSINNVVNVTSTSVDTNPDNNEDDDYITIGPEADLELTKVADVHTVTKGDIVTWTITVTNNGPNDAIGAYVEDIIPDGLEFISASSRYYNKDTGIWYIGHLEDGATVTLTIRTKVTTSNTEIENYAVVNSTIYDPNPANNDDDDDIVVITEADVEVIKLVSNSTAHYGDTVTWTIIVTNNGPNVAENVILTDYLPEGLITIGTPSTSVGHVYVDTEGHGIWNIGNLEVNQTVSCTVITTVNTTNAEIHNVVVVNTTSHDPDLSNNQAENITVIPPECDVTVVKTVSNHTPNKGETIVWTIAVYNNGPNVAENVVVEDILPEGLEYVSHERPTQGSFTDSTGNWTVGTLDVNSRQTLTITTKVVDTGLITNEVNVTTSTYDTDLTNNYDNETIDVPAIADLEITKLVSNKTPNYGDLINWTISVTNHGPNNARNVVVYDELPNGLIYVTHSADTGLYDPSQGIWQIGTVHYGNETFTLTITTRVNVTNTTITNVAVVTSTTPDSNETNNEANNTTTVEPSADLEIIKIVNNTGPKYGENIIWTITVTNNGPDIAVNTIAHDIIPEGLIYISSEGEGSYDNDTGIWTIGDLAKGESAVLNITTFVNVTKEIITNYVNVTSDTPDPDETNNEDNDSVDVGHEADLSVVKIVSNSTPSYGNEIIWTINVTNHGPDDAVEVYVTENIPEGLVYVSDDSNGAYNYTTGIWTIGNLTNGSSVSLAITTLVNITNKNISNIVVVEAETHDPYLDNNTDTENITVKAMADLWLIKEVYEDNATYGDSVLWMIYVMNLGPDTAIDAYVEDKIPDGLIYDDYRANRGTYNSTTGIWTIGNLTSGDMVVLYIWTIVNQTTGNITNVAVVNSSTPDPDETNNKDNDTVPINTIADLEVVKIVSNKTTHYGETITWTIKVTNNGPSDAKGVYVTDELPKGLVYSTHETETGDYDSETGIWTIGELANGESVSLIITTLVNVSNTTITNVAVVNSSTPDSDESNNKANNTTVVDPEADLEIIKLVSNATVKYGDVITWTITVTNKGPDSAVNVYVRDTFPVDLILNDYEVTKGLFDAKSNTWFISILANGESQNLTLTTKVNASSTIINVVNVTNDVYDPNETNNEANNTTVVDPRANLVVVKEVSDKNPSYGDTITWTITVTNNGPDTAVNVKVTDKLPDGLVFKGSDGDYDSDSGVWTVGNLTNGQSSVLVITTLVNFTNATVLNAANVTSDTPGNRTNGTNDTTSKPIADLEVIKLVSNSNAKKGDVIVWTIVVTNNGPDTAVNTNVTDKLPSGLTYNSHSTETGVYDSVKGLWIIGDLINGASVTLEITTTVNIDNGTITNIAVVNSSTPDNNTDNNKANNTTTVNDDADLAIIKLVSNANPHKGDTVIWTITVTNNGPSDAKDVVVTDKLPDSLIFVSANGNYDKVTGVWTIGDLANGKSTSLVITTIVNITNTTIRNVANVTSSTPDSNKTNNEANNTTVVDPEADLVIIKSVSNSTPVKGDIITWTITVTNNGPDNAVNVVITDTIPDGLTVIENGRKLSTNTITVEIPLIKTGATETFTFQTLVEITNATITNVVVVESDTYDPNKTNNEDNETVDVAPEADLEIIKLVSNAISSKGDIITWTIIVTNNGPDTAKNIYVNDDLPTGLVYSSHSVTKGLFDSTANIWFITSLSNGESATLTLNTLVNTSSTTLLNIVNVTNDVYDPNETNNVANNTTVVDNVKSADLEVIKIVSDSNPHKGDTITWTITVTNNGPDAASDVTVTDKLPTGLTFVSADGNYDKSTGVWTIGDMANGETKTLVITTVVAITNANITNVAVVNSSTDDPNPDNNKDNETSEIDPEADVKVIKTVSNTKPTVGDTITWTIVVTNLGPDTAEDVEVSESLPNGLKLVSAKGSKGTYSNGVWTIGDLTNGEIATLTLTTKVTATGTIENIVVATTTTYDPNETNNKDKEVTKPKDAPKSADLEIIKVANKDKVKVGDKIIWTITVINHGPDKAENVRVTDWASGDMEFLSSKESKGTFDFMEGIWTIGDMEAGETAVLQITCRALSEIINFNFASVESDTPDHNEDNNFDMASVEVEGSDVPTPENPDVPATSKMHATGNPSVMVLLSLLALAGAGLKRKN